MHSPKVVLAQEKIVLHLKTDRRILSNYLRPGRLSWPECEVKKFERLTTLALPTHYSKQ